MKTFPIILALALICLASIVSATTKVTSCLGSDGSQTVTIKGCKSKECKLTKGKDADISIKFKAQDDSATLENKVTALLLGIEWPFVGVTGTSACGDLYYTNGTSASCPLVKGEEYVYKSSFEVYDVYPDVTTTVTWKLVDASSVNDVCFKIKAKIVS